MHVLLLPVPIPSHILLISFILQIQAVHKQKEMVNKSWENFLTRTSNYEALKVKKKKKSEWRSKIFIHNVVIITGKFQTHFLMNYEVIHVKAVVNFMFTQI